MATRDEKWRLFGWQGLCLRVPEEWDLGRVDGDYGSGYARLDDAEMVRAEIEWREVPTRGRRLPVSQVVDRYLDKLIKKAEKADMPFAVQRRARFLKDKRWLEGSEYEAFLWEADYRAYNVARVCGQCGRIVLLRLLARVDENLEGLVNEVFPSLVDHPEGDQLTWSVYGMTFRMPSDYKLSNQDLKSGHIQLTFEQKGHVCRMHRLSMAQTMLRGAGLSEWYPAFFKKQLRDFDFEVLEEEARGHAGIRIRGRPRSRWRQMLRPMPFINPRPRQYLDGRVWHCEVGNRICIAEHLYRRRDAGANLTDTLTDGFICHPKGTAPDAGGHDGLPAGAQRGSEVGEERGG